MRRPLAVVLAVLALASCRRSPEGPSGEETSARHPAPRRLVAIGDLHGDLEETRRTLRMAGLVDATDRWTGGEAWLVQTGDLTDKGPDTRAVLDLFIALERQAEAAGGRVLVLTSNHEALNVGGASRSVNPDDALDFAPPGVAGKPDPSEADLAAALAGRAAAFAPAGVYGRWILGHDAVAVVGDTVFVHGGLTPAYAGRGLAAINEEVRAILGAGRYEGIVAERVGPLWYRGHVTEPEPKACPELERALALVGAKRMVVGHTPDDARIDARCGGQLVAIDSGIAKAMGGGPSALEIVGGDARAIHPDGVTDLPDPT